MNPKIIMLNERSQTKKGTYYMIPLYKVLENENQSIVAESRSVSGCLILGVQGRVNCQGAWKNLLGIIEIFSILVITRMYTNVRYTKLYASNGWRNFLYIKTVCKLDIDKLKSQRSSLRLVSSPPCQEPGILYLITPPCMASSSCPRWQHPVSQLQDGGRDKEEGKEHVQLAS